MRQAILRETLCVDANHQLHINVPVDMGDKFEVIVLPILVKEVDELNDDDEFMLEAYSAVVESNPEEDLIWEQYVRS